MSLHTGSHESKPSTCMCILAIIYDNKQNANNFFIMSLIHFTIKHNDFKNKQYFFLVRPALTNGTPALSREASASEEVSAPDGGAPQL